MSKLTNYINNDNFEVIKSLHSMGFETEGIKKYRVGDNHSEIIQKLFLGAENMLIEYQHFQKKDGFRSFDFVLFYNHSQKPRRKKAIGVYTNQDTGKFCISEGIKYFYRVTDNTKKLPEATLVGYGEFSKAYRNFILLFTVGFFVLFFLVAKILFLLGVLFSMPFIIYAVFYSIKNKQKKIFSDNGVLQWTLDFKNQKAETFFDQQFFKTLEPKFFKGVFVIKNQSITTVIDDASAFDRKTSFKTMIAISQSIMDRA